jgi:pyruvate dehydrogenase E1 component beta subunit
MYLEAPIRRVGAADVPIPQSSALERAVIPQADDIVTAIRAITQKSVAA